MCIYFSDHNGQETSSNSFIRSLIQQQEHDSVIICQDELRSETRQVPHYFVFLPLSKSILKYSVEKIMNQVKSIKENPLIKQSFVWITPKNIDHHFIIPFIMHLADTVVEFVNDKELMILQKKAHGTIQKRVRRKSNFTYT